MKKHFTNIASQYFGKFASKKFPKPVQEFINKSYVNLMGLDMSEFEEASSFDSLNALFTRALKTPRVLSEASLISPSDSYISECGEIKKDIALQIKGFCYSVDELLKEELNGGSFINLYLSPKDYHRYHAPCDMQILSALYVPGLLYPVNFTYLKKVPELFCKNERVILKCKSEVYGLFYMVFVGALNVGKMVFGFDANIQTNANAHQDMKYDYQDLYVKKGDELGYFMMGSTIVMLFENDLGFSKKDVHVKFGDDLLA